MSHRMPRPAASSVWRIRSATKPTASICEARGEVSPFLYFVAPPLSPGNEEGEDAYPKKDPHAAAPGREVAGLGEGVTLKQLREIARQDGLATAAKAYNTINRRD
jgi:hypothetical protein